MVPCFLVPIPFIQPSINDRFAGKRIGAGIDGRHCLQLLGVIANGKSGSALVMIVGGLCETAFELKASDTDGLQFSQISSTHSRRNEMTTRLQAHALHVIPNRAVGQGPREYSVDHPGWLV